jgi:hypothetical protein
LFVRLSGVAVWQRSWLVHGGEQLRILGRRTPDEQH